MGELTFGDKKGEGGGVVKDKNLVGGASTGGIFPGGGNEQMVGGPSPYPSQ